MTKVVLQDICPCCGFEFKRYKHFAFKFKGKQPIFKCPSCQARLTPNPEIWRALKGNTPSFIFVNAAVFSVVIFSILVEATGTQMIVLTILVGGIVFLLTRKRGKNIASTDLDKQNYLVKLDD